MQHVLVVHVNVATLACLQLWNKNIVPINGLKIGTTVLFSGQIDQQSEVNFDLQYFLGWAPKSEHCKLSKI